MRNLIGGLARKWTVFAHGRVTGARDENPHNIARARVGAWGVNTPALGQLEMGEWTSKWKLLQLVI